MHQSIERLTNLLDEGKASLHELLNLRRELQAPFKLHPLGFIACTLITEGTRKLRLHYWPSIGGAQQSPECQIHDHLFEFKSWVMAGSIANIEYIPADNGKEFSVYQTEYVNDQSILKKIEKKIALTEHRRTIYNAGSSYMLKAGILHETILMGTSPAFTVLLTTDVSSAAPLVFGPTNGQLKYIYQRETLDESHIEKMLSCL